jgi:hypothetical protein
VSFPSREKNQKQETQGYGARKSGPNLGSSSQLTPEGSSISGNFFTKTVWREIKKRLGLKDPYAGIARLEI